MSIYVQGLTRVFGEQVAVDHISFEIKPGNIVGFLGPNGAGKSTTMKMITGFLEPDSGTARITGYDVQEQPLAAKAHLGYLPEGAPAYAEMTPAKFLRFIAAIRGFRGAEAQRRVDAAVDKTGLHSVLHQNIETLSKGYKRRVGIAQAILHDPQVLIMDEPTDGLDPNQKHQVRELIRDMARDKAIIVSTHILEEVEAVCTRAVVIDKGRIVADGTAEDLRQRAPNHGAVAIRVATDQAEIVMQALQRFPSIATVETLGKANGHLHLRALPKNGMSIAAEVTQAIRESAIVVEEIYVERGKLDDVFRQITTSDQGGGHA